MHFVGARAKKEYALSSETTPEILNEVKFMGVGVVLEKTGGLGSP